MNIKVVFHSKTGNTKKVAEAMASAAGTSAIDIYHADSILSEQVDLLFVGDGMYYAGIDKSTKEFISKLDSKKIKCAAVFSTSGNAWSFGPTGISKRLERQGVQVFHESFRCHGNAFGIAYPSRPNEEDLKNAAQFAKRVIAANSND